jgi:CBS domain-containing protein
MRYVEGFRKKVVTTDPNESLAGVTRLMEAHNTGTVVVVENGRPVGIVTDRDLALELGVRGTSPQTPVARVMTTPVETIYEKEGIFAATKVMAVSKVRRLPIVDNDDRLVGIVAQDDLYTSRQMEKC